MSFEFKKSSQEIKNIKDKKKKKKTTYKRSQIREKEIGRQKQKGEKTKKKDILFAAIKGLLWHYNLTILLKDFEFF